MNNLKFPGNTTFKKSLFIALLILFFCHLGYRIYTYQTDYLQPFDSDYWEDRYNKSQWIVPDSENPIGDDGLYTFVAWEYINGRDPTTIQAETPPLGKYLIGLSIIVFNNQNVFALLSGIFALFFFYKLNRTIFLEPVYALLPVVLFSLEPIFYMQLRAPFLDTLYLGFFMTTVFYFFKERFLLTGLFLGLMMATKASSATFLLCLAAFAIYLLYMRKYDRIKKALLILPISTFVFTLTYIMFFLNGNGPVEFIKVQSYVLNFYAEGADPVRHAVWQMMITGFWPTWFGTTQSVAEWRFSWPILLGGLFLFSLFLVWQRFPRERIVFCWIWLLLYFAFLMVVPIFPRYLLLILPFLYNLSIWFLPFFAATRQQ